MTTSITYNAVNIQPDVAEFNPGTIIRALQEVSIVDRLIPPTVMDSEEKFMAVYYETTGQKLPDWEARLIKPKRTDITSQRKEKLVGLLQEEISMDIHEYNLMVRDPINNLSAREALLGPVFSEKRNNLFFAGNSIGTLDLNPIDNATRATDLALTLKDTTTYLGTQKMFGEIFGDMRTAMKGMYGAWKQNSWVVATSDIFANWETTFSTITGERTLDAVLKLFNGEVYPHDALGATLGTDGTVSAAGTITILVGSRMKQIGTLYQTGFNRRDISSHIDEKVFRYRSRYLPHTFRTIGYGFEDAVTV